MGLDCHKANLWVWVVLIFSDPIKALIEGRMKEQGGMESQMEKGRVSDEESCAASSASFTHFISP